MSENEDKAPKENKPKKQTKDGKTTLKLREQIATLNEDLLRAQADLINYRNRSEDEKITKYNAGKTSALTSLLPAVDNIERALSSIPEDIADHDYFKGISGVLKQFESALTGMGIQRIVTKDQDFNPETMQAVAIDDKGGDREVVAEELQTGYKLGDQIIRPAIVKVEK